MVEISPQKKYIQVNVDYMPDGRMIPRRVTWEDGHSCEIDRVTDIRPAPALKAGGRGDRYTVLIGGKQSYLFFERSAQVVGCRLGRWFVERQTEQ